MGESELLTGLMDVEYVERSRDCYWLMRAVLERMGAAEGRELPADAEAAMAALPSRAMDVPAGMAAQAGDVVLMVWRDVVEGEHFERQHVGVCLDAFRVVHMTRGAGVTIVGLGTLRRLDRELRVLRLMPRVGSQDGLETPAGTIVSAGAGSVAIAVYDDVLTRKNPRTTWVTFPRGQRGSVAAMIDLVRGRLGLGRFTQSPLLVALNGRIVDDTDWCRVMVGGGDEVVIAPRPCEFGTGVLIAIALASAVASSLLVARVPHPATQSESQRRFAFGRYSSDAVVGDTVPVFFGTHERAGGKTIVKVPGEGPDGDTKIKILIDYGRGPIAQIGNQTTDVDRVPASALSGIYFNDQAISNFPGVTASVRMGTPGQAVIPGFDDTETLREVGVGGSAMVNTSGTERSGGSASAEAVSYTTLDAVNAIVMRVRFSRGLFSVSSGGQTNSRSASYRYRTRLHAGPGAWSAWAVVTVSRADQSEFFSAARAENLNGGTAAIHDIEVERVSVDATSASDVDDMILDSVQEIQYAENTYAGKALLAIEITASEQLTSPPRVSADIRGYAALRIWDGISSPEAPAFTTGWSGNPADIALELMTNAEWGAGAAYTDAAIDFASLLEWREYCDEPVARISGGGTRPRHMCNLALREQRKAIDWLRAVCRTGRCQPSPTGSVWRFIVDRVRATAVETFTDRSIAVDESGVALIEYTREVSTGGTVRPNRLVAQFTNELADGRPDTIGFPTLGELWLADEPLREESVRLEGVTDPEQVAAELVYMAKRIRGLSRSVKFTTSKQVPVVQPGERFDLASSLPGWGLASGGVAAGSTTTAVKLDRSITLGGGDYVIRVTHQDGSVEDRAVTAAAGTYAAGDAINTDAFADAPAEFEEYAIGEDGVHVKPFTCTRVALVDAARMLWEIAGVEYAEDVYDDTPGEVDLPDYSTLRSVTTAPGPVLALVAVERTTNGIRTVVLSWRQAIDDAEHTGSFRLYRRMIGTTTWVLDPSATPGRRQQIIELADLDRAYQFIVVAVSIGGTSLSPYDTRHPIATLVYGLSQAPPPPPTGLTLTLQVDNTYTLSWDEAAGAVGYQVLTGGDVGTGLPNDGAEDSLVLARTVDPELAGLRLAAGRSVTFWVRSEGPSGRLSNAAAVVTLASPAIASGQSIKQTRVFDLATEGTLTNLTWNAGESRLELVSAAAAGGGVWTGPQISTGSTTLTDLRFRPATANDADDPAINTDPFRVPSVAADQWGIIDATPTIGMMMPPWPDEEQVWLFELRTYDGAWSAWETLAACARVQRLFSSYQVRATLTRRNAPYRPALRGLEVVLTH